MFSDLLSVSQLNFQTCDLKLSMENREGMLRKINGRLHLVLETITNSRLELAQHGISEFVCFPPLVPKDSYLPDEQSVQPRHPGRACVLLVLHSLVVRVIS